MAVKRNPRAKRRGVKLTRAEKNDLVRQRLFGAAVKVVGKYGYADASVARITKLANVAQGTFYNHFANRQELLDQLLPTVGKDMLAFIKKRVDPAAGEADKELARFKAFFAFLTETPEFMRILNEAIVFAPIGYQKHIEVISENYMRALTRGQVGEGQFTPKELEVVIFILLGARSYLSHHYAYVDSQVQTPPDYLFTAYHKLITMGPFSDSTARKKATPKKVLS